MVASAVTAIYAWQHVGHAAPDQGPDRPRAQQGTSSDGSFMDKMEERWRRRRDESGF